MKKLSFLASRWFVAPLVLAAVSLAIWFLGPYLTFGELRPLADPAMRVVLIALLLLGVLLWLRGLPTSPVFVVLLCLLVWNAAPLIGVGQSQPFGPASSRIAALAVILGCFALYVLIRLFHRMRTDKDFLNKALSFGNKAEPAPAAGRLRQIEAHMNGALARLKSMRTGARGVAKMFQGSRYLYELPWYVALGSNQCGKTSALLQSGLQFPNGHLTGRATGTQGVDWWLTNDAVLIDTAGHYARHGTSSGPLPARVSATESTRTEPAPDPAPGSSDSQWRGIVDADEWRGFMALLRRRRPRLPINGALLTVKLDVLTTPDASVRTAEATAMRARLEELREQLGVAFPVYLLITQTDRLPGFSDYFGSLTKEHRAQIWGFTLPLDAGNSAMRCMTELAQLAERLSRGLNARLDDEYDVTRRRRLAVLPEAYDALQAPLVDFVSQLFAESRYDATQSHGNLRGVYFTSAIQSGEQIEAEPLTVVQRLESSLGQKVGRDGQPAQSAHGFFLDDLFSQVILPEAHLVRPNLRQEYRSRALRVLGHGLALLLFVWLAVSLFVSYGNNREYLAAIANKTRALGSRVSQLYRSPAPEAVPDTLTDAHTLPAWTGLDLDDPDSSFLYGLYTPPRIIGASRDTYRALEDTLLLPQIVRRIEDVLAQSIAQQDAKSTYEALRVYLMLYDRSTFSAADVKAWVLDDWARTDSAAVFGGRAAMIGHVQRLFSGERLVQSPLIRNDALIQRARGFLDASNSTQRVYERAKAAMSKDAPDEFSLLRAVGPQAGTVFTRASGTPLSRGVAGIFTFNGYRDVFDKRLHEFVAAARTEDGWVMGRSTLEAAQKKTVEFASAMADVDDPLSSSIRRLYLTEYAQTWDAFLNDIRPVSGTSLAFNLQVLRRFAAPDSPITRLATAVAQETALTRAVEGENSLLQKATDKLASKAKALGIRPHERVEKELVDNHFAALREMVTGSPDSRPATGDTSTIARATGAGLEGVTTLLNDYYTALTITESAIANNSLPPASDAASKLRMAANTMPAPLHDVLLGLSSEGTAEVNQSIGQLLSRQMEAVIGDTCRLTIEGNYPFEPASRRDVSIDDFTRLFAQDGVLDNFFTKNLAPFVDTAARPWRYKSLPGSTEPVVGPSLEPFQHAKAIRELFFTDPGQKQLAWKTDVRVADLDPSILGLTIDIDGQSVVYQHGPVTPFRVTWPGLRGGVNAELSASPRIRADTSALSASGAWAFMRLLRLGQIVQTATLGRTRVVYDFDGRKAVLDIINTGSLANPLTSDLLTTFHCPSAASLVSLPDSGPPLGLPAGVVG